MPSLFKAFKKVRSRPKCEICRYFDEPVDETDLKYSSPHFALTADLKARVARCGREICSVLVDGVEHCILEDGLTALPLTMAIERDGEGWINPCLHIAIFKSEPEPDENFRVDLIRLEFFTLEERQCHTSSCPETEITY
jgi:hypothetical protein